MNIRKILISLTIILSFLVLVYFLLVKYHHTKLVKQLEQKTIKTYATIIYKDELNYVKSILKVIVNNKTPPNNWSDLIDSEIQNQEIFWFFKVWFTERNILKQDIENSYPIFVYNFDNKLAFDIEYKKNEPAIRAQLTQKNTLKKISFSFPLNNSLFQPDYNNDGVINQEDVNLAKKKYINI